MKKDGTRKSSFSRLMRTAALSLVAGYAAITTTADLADRLQTRTLNAATAHCETRKTFMQEHNIPLEGKIKDIEERPYSYADLWEVAARENLERPSTLTALRVGFMPSDIIFGYSKTTDGAYHQYTDRICVAPSAVWVLRESLHHEWKHNKTFEIIEQHPEFLDRWRRITTEVAGEEAYVGEDWKSLPEDGKNYVVNEGWIALGFLRNYARKNEFEHIAELCAKAETDPTFFKMRREPLYEPLWRFIRLAEQYRLLPREFEEYIDMMALRNDDIVGTFEYGRLSPERRQRALDRADAFLYQSGAFLEQYPESVYAADVHFARASALNEAKRPGSLQRIEQELDAALAAKDRNYRRDMNVLSYGSYVMRGSERGEAYRRAYEHYDMAIRANNPGAIRDGARQFFDRKSFVDPRRQKTAHSQERER